MLSSVRVYLCLEYSWGCQQLQILLIWLGVKAIKCWALVSINIVLFLIPIQSQEIKLCSSGSSFRWFNRSLFPFSALGRQTPDFQFCPLSLMNALQVLLTISGFSIKMDKPPQDKSIPQSPSYQSGSCSHKSSLPQDLLDAITYILSYFVQSFYFLLARKLVQIFWSSIIRSELLKFYL